MARAIDGVAALAKAGDRKGALTELARLVPEFSSANGG
jgi:hypothetical protein